MIPEYDFKQCRGLAPMHIQPLLEIYSRVLLRDMPNVNNRIIDQLLGMELIQKKEVIEGPDRTVCEYELTDRGEVYIHALLDVPLPTKQWIIR